MRMPMMKTVTWYLVIAIALIFSIAPGVEAGLTPSGFVTAKNIDRQSDMATIQKALEMKMVGERLTQLGFTQDEVQTRLQGMSDQQVHEVAQNLDSLMAGGDGLGFIIGVLVIAILVVVLLQLTGHKVIIK